jgi:hypothetical protein
MASSCATVSSTVQEPPSDRADNGQPGSLPAKSQSLAKALGGTRETPVDALRKVAVPGKNALANWFAADAGRWVYPDAWQAETLARAYPSASALEETTKPGWGAATTLMQLMRGEKVTPPAAYLAVLVQDLDSMGKFLSGEPVGGAPAGATLSAAGHETVSKKLSLLGKTLRDGLAAPEYMGVPVYAGGDDLLAFVPARTALAAARFSHDAIPDNLPTASTAVLFFHHFSSLQQAVSHGQELLTAAKEARTVKHGLAVGYMRRSGTREASQQPWVRDGSDRQELGPDTDFTLFAPPVTGKQPLPAAGEERRGLSLRLVADLARDAEELSDKRIPPELYEAEVRRLVTRHGGTAPEAEALLRLGESELTPTTDTEPEAMVEAEPRTEAETGQRGHALVAAARVAAFLRRECQ